MEVSLEDRLSDLRGRLADLVSYERESLERCERAVQDFDKTVSLGEAMKDFILDEIARAELFNQEVMRLKNRWRSELSNLEKGSVKVK